MINPGVRSLGDFPIGAAGSWTGAWVTNIDGMVSMAVQLRLAYGQGGDAIRAYVQTAFGADAPAIDLACVLFGTASEVALLNLSTTSPVLTQVVPTDGTMADDTALAGSVIGDRIRVKIVSTGLYAGSTVLACRAVVR